MHNLSDVTTIHHFQSKNYLLERRKPVLIYSALCGIDHVRDTIQMRTDIGERTRSMQVIIMLR